MTSIRLEPFPFDAWQQMDRVRAAPTFFARPAWALALQRAYPELAPHPLCCRLDRGLAIVPLMYSSSARWGWKILQGMPLGSYTAVLMQGGDLADPPLAAQVLSEVLRQADEVELVPWPMSNVRLEGAAVRKVDEASVLDISGGTDRALSQVGSKSRRMAGQARRRGVSCGIESGDPAVETYYDLLIDAAKNRWNISQPRLKKELVRAVCASDSVELWLARFEGSPIAGGIALYGREEVLLWTTATRTGMEILRPHNILHWDIIEHAAARGLHWYNLGSSAGLPGVLRFKEALGAKAIAYQVIGKQSPLLRIASGLRRVFGLAP